MSENHQDKQEERLDKTIAWNTMGGGVGGSTRSNFPKYKSTTPPRPPYVQDPKGLEKEVIQKQIILGCLD